MKNSKMNICQLSDDVVKIANEYNMNLNVELKGITGPNGLALSKSMVKQVEEQLTT
ncbi:Glycerophosphoryl diester phosphodiesterase [Staphylococcus aureus]|nr:Glycerophosphoryl diester phosphodiesterase [Staphylococcus aureus]